MALSNWATLTWNENGEPCDGRLEVEGISIDIYKNWIYVRDEKAWKEGSITYNNGDIRRTNRIS